MIEEIQHWGILPGRRFSGKRSYFLEIYVMIQRYAFIIMPESIIAA
jgi:hypothetical protein